MVFVQKTEVFGIFCNNFQKNYGIVTLYPLFSMHVFNAQLSNYTICADIALQLTY